MTKEELEKILNGKDLMSKIDVKSLVIDIINHYPEEEIISMFYDKLGMIDESYLKRFFYMTRD